MDNYFYAVGAGRDGPISESGLRDLFRAGVVVPETLVWRDGMTDWQPLATVFPQWPAGARPEVGFGEETAVCVVSGHRLPKAEMIRFDDAFVSPECRDVYLQRLQQGLPLGEVDLIPGGIWKRLGAYGLDLLMVAIAPFLILIAVSLIAGEEGDLTDGQAQVFGLGVILLLLAYETVMVGAWGATLGKMVCRLEVVRRDGSRPGYGQALGRALIKHVIGQLCSGLITLISLIKAIRDRPWHQSLHDESTKTRVVCRRR